MVDHEKSCTLNPGRICYLCKGSFDLPSLIERAIKASVKDDFGGLRLDDQSAFNAIYDDVEECPACMLSILRQSKVIAFELFDYKKEKSEWATNRHIEAVANWG